MPSLKRISFRDVPAIARAYRYLLVAAWMLFVRRHASDTWLKRWSEAAVDHVPSEVETLAAKRSARWANTAARYPFPWARCLQRSLALSMWMDAQNLNPVLRIGVRKSESGIDAHSWVEFDGEILNDSEFVGTRFVAFDVSGEPRAPQQSDVNGELS